VCVTHTNSGAQEGVIGKREDARDGYSGRNGTENLESPCEMGDRSHCVRVLLIG
jgi:hypothetical protein